LHSKTPQYMEQSWSVGEASPYFSLWAIYRVYQGIKMEWFIPMDEKPQLPKKT